MILLNILLLFITLDETRHHVSASPSIENNIVFINKCCERFEILVDLHCTKAKDLNQTVWSPTFTGYDGTLNVKVADYKYLIGQPDCGKMQFWNVFHDSSNHDYLFLFPDGKLGHYIKNHDKYHDEDEDEPEDLKELLKDKSRFFLYHDFNHGHYCIDKAVTTNGTIEHKQYAMVCSPEKILKWTDTDFLLRKIINPILHGISIVILLIIAIIYFVIPTLRDLVGNIVTTITICLIVSQAADLIRILTQSTSHVSFAVAPILFTSLLGAFFWLNSLGYYIWKTFRTKNVFLRVTDGRKYCWYMLYAWGSTITMAILAVFGHFYLDTGPIKEHDIFEDQETIGWLGMAIFFTPISFTIIINIFFYVTTMKVMNRINCYGRIQYKLKCNFIMFILMFVVMSVAWIFLILSWLRNDTLLYMHIFVNFLQAPLLLYILVIRQKQVIFLLKKVCCFNQPITGNSVVDWGDEELSYMNENNGY